MGGPFPSFIHLLVQTRVGSRWLAWVRVLHKQDNSLKKLIDSFPSRRGKKVYTWIRRTVAFSPDGRKALF